MSSSPKKLLSLIIPAYNEEKNIRPLLQAVTAAFAQSPYALEIIFVNDGSTDATAAAIEALAAADPRVRSLELSRNFGKEAALSAGISEAAGDAIVMLDADLQHPPERIPDFIAEWERGAEVVIGIRTESAGESYLRRLGSRLFTFLMNRLSDVPAILHETDFRLIDRKVADAFMRFNERRRMTRGIIDWLGFRRAFVTFSAPKRANGAPQYGYRKLFGLAFSAIIAHSFFPLRLAGYLGIGITFLAGVLGLFAIVQQFILGDPLGLQWTPLGLTVILILFLVGIILVCLGLMALYIESIKHEVTGRPLYVVRERLGRARS